MTLDPLVPITALSVSTDHIGVVATHSTTIDLPCTAPPSVVGHRSSDRRTSGRERGAEYVEFFSPLPAVSLHELVEKCANIVGCQSSGERRTVIHDAREQ